VPGEQDDMFKHILGKREFVRADTPSSLVSTVHETHNTSAAEACADPIFQALS